MLSASKKVDYAILVMASLPESGEHLFRSLQDISKEKQLSLGFLTQIMVFLKKANLVKAKEGLYGGYQLAKPSREISIGEIYEALEGPICLTTCLDAEKTCICEHACPTRTIWEDLQYLMNQYLKKKFLSEFKSHHETAALS